MPITGPTSYLTTTDEFLAHWEAANTTLGVGNEIVLAGGITVAMLQAKKNLLVTKRALVEAKLNLVEAARGDIDNRKAALLVRINQFKEAVQADFPGSTYERTLPQVPSINDGQGVFVKALDDANTGWAMVNADPAFPDLTLLGGYTQATFDTDITALGAAYTTYNKAGKIVDITIQERNDIQDEIYDILLAYRKKLPTKFPKNHALVESLPELTPAPGSTPKAVTAGGSFDATQQKAKLNCSESTDPNLQEYEWRYCVGPNYSTEVEAVVPGGNVPAGGNREIFSDIGLTSPGAVATFRVYVKTTTGNEKGSNTITILRPTGPLP